MLNYIGYLLSLKLIFNLTILTSFYVIFFYYILWVVLVLTMYCIAESYKGIEVCNGLLRLYVKLD